MAELLELLSIKRDCNKIKDLSNKDGHHDHDQRKSHSAEQVPEEAQNIQKSKNITNTNSNSEKYSIKT